MEAFKTPIEQSNAMLEPKVQPFNTKSISQKKWQTPENMFENHRIVQMSPNDYYKFAAHFGHYKTPEALMRQRERVANEMSVADMRKAMREGRQFDTPWLKLDDAGDIGYHNAYWQEGLHRMLAAGQEYGMDTKFPVYLGYETDPWDEIEKMPMDKFIEHYDTTRKNRYDEQVRLRNDEDARIEAEWRKDTADYFNIPVDQVTEEHIKKYNKFMDDLFKEELGY